MGHPKDGYIMYVVLLLVLTVMGTTIALADRTTSGLAGQMRQSVLRDAELATENGLTRVITDMNSPANRYVWGVKTANWANLGDWAQNETIRDKLYPYNICKGVTYGHHEKFRNTREPAHETHVLVRTGLLRPSVLQQFFEVPLFPQ